MTAIENFLKESNYYTEPLNKAELIKAFEAKGPYVVRLEPFANGDSMVDAGIKELKIAFPLRWIKKGILSTMEKRKRIFTYCWCNWIL